MKSILLLAFLLTFTFTSFAQVSGSLGLHFTAAKSGGNPTQDVGINGGAAYSYEGVATVFGEAFARDGFLTRFRTGGFASLPYKGFVFQPGGGYQCYGRCVGSLDNGFGHLGVKYEDAQGFVRLGGDRFLEGEAAYNVASVASVSIQPFVRATRHQVCNQTQTVYQFGTRFVFAESK